MRISQKDSALLAKILETPLTQLQSKFDDVEFYILIYPSDSIPNYASMLLPFLNPKIHVLYYRDLFKTNDEHFHLPLNAHPNEKAISVIGEKLMEKFNF